MTILKQCIAVAVFGVLCVQQTMAAKYTMEPNNIPKTIHFRTAQASGRTATISFRSSVLPVNISCYFGETNGKLPKNVTAVFSSEQNELIFLDGTEEQLSSNAGNTALIQIRPLQKKIGNTEMNISIVGNDPRLKTIPMICAMNK